MRLGWGAWQLYLPQIPREWNDSISAAPRIVKPVVKV
jgi:hypothetical protein